MVVVLLSLSYIVIESALQQIPYSAIQTETVTGEILEIYKKKSRKIFRLDNGQYYTLRGAFTNLYTKDNFKNLNSLLYKNVTIRFESSQNERVETHNLISLKHNGHELVGETAYLNHLSSEKTSAYLLVVLWSTCLFIMFLDWRYGLSLKILS